MDDSCAVCADNLEWVAYGSCGHREVCTTCVVRLRFICGDRRCCICKTESPFIFVTKALGDYTRTINDFSTFPSERKDGRIGSFWYHEDTQAFFDDLDQFMMIKAMCRLSCSVCDKAERQSKEGPKHHVRFKSVEQLKGHLYHRHELHMCSLCLEGRKVFICEQKLYTRAQLDQHISTGDSEVDGNENERGGFTGHPMCEFCRNPFYGDNELYTHMSTEHYTCHICQRVHPGKYEYYRNYEHLEMHFRGDHFLCEDDSCLVKKFIVFHNEAELKRHNTVEHGGKMSRSQRSAALQIPTSFRYHRGSERENRHEPSGDDDDFVAAIQASMVTSRAESARLVQTASSNAPGFSEYSATGNVHPLTQPFETLGESSFPPLSVQASNGQSRSGQNLGSLPNNTMAARLRHQKNRSSTTTSPSPAWPARNGHGPVLASSTIAGNSAAAWPAVCHGRLQSSTSRLPAISRDADSGHISVRGNSSGSTRNSVAAAQNRKPSTNSQASNTSAPSRDRDVKYANKSLVEKIRACLGHDEDLYVSFKDISGQYRHGLVDAETYLDYVKGFGLSDLVLDLARLCPDPKKQKELIDTHNSVLRGVEPRENGGWAKDKGKGVKVESSSNSRDGVLADSFVDLVRRLQSSYRPQDEDAEEPISKDEDNYGPGKSESQKDTSSRGLKKSKQRKKKTSKFHRVRLGEGSKAALLDLRNSDRGAEPESKEDNSNRNGTQNPPTGGVWRKGEV
ncbi:PREDICTED: zinc finger protein 598-like isoform X2 [Tarenaya hassleriana]|uniref:zinc finger protein 598-like isoform X2 n=1 Tax=Tarenaya hassleriana TaxID=28532 RepID=UPI00053CA98F|nr:PREDICTED: zinc finger protein 598-like isoform X2 [Tarenaya hassleriana]